MMYSSGIFEHLQMTLEEASIAKLERICRKLDLKPGDRVIEIGTGWGIRHARRAALRLSRHHHHFAFTARHGA